MKYKDLSVEQYYFIQSVLVQRHGNIRSWPRPDEKIDAEEIKRIADMEYQDLQSEEEDVKSRKDRLKALMAAIGAPKKKEEA